METECTLIDYAGLAYVPFKIHHPACAEIGNIKLVFRENELCYEACILAPYSAIVCLLNTIRIETSLNANTIWKFFCRVAIGLLASRNHSKD